MSTTYTSTATFTRTQTVNFLTDELLNKLKLIIRESGLSPVRFADDFDSNELAIRTWLTSGHFEYLIFEVYDKTTDGLVRCWHLHVSADGTGFDGLWANPAALRYALAKENKVPSQCDYKIRIQNKPGRPDVAGWSPGTARSTNHLHQSSAGTIATANGHKITANLFS